MNRNSARLFGIFFILSFVSYAAGMELMESIQNSRLQPYQVIENKASVVTGAILTAVFHSLFNVGLLVSMFNVLKSTNKALSIAYLVSGCFGTLLLAIGAAFLLIPVPVSETLVQTNQFEPPSFAMVLSLSSGGNFFLYQIGMILWSCSGLIFCYLLRISKLVPTLFPVWGFLGYLTFVTGCFLELFGIPWGIKLAVPGGLFELSLSIWSIAKGFSKHRIPAKPTA